MAPPILKMDTNIGGLSKIKEKIYLVSIIYVDESSFMSAGKYKNQSETSLVSIYTYMESPGPAPRNFFFIVLQFSGSAKV